MKLESESFVHDGLIPPEYTCDGQGINPHLRWSEYPQETRFFALACVDPDAPLGEFIHWMIYNIPVKFTQIGKGAGSPGGLEVNNHFGRGEYGGPCPPSGTHRYYFTVYALDREISEHLTKENFRQRVGEHSLAKAVLMGRYSRK